MNSEGWQRKIDQMVRVAERAAGPHSRMSAIATHALEQLDGGNEAFVRGLTELSRWPVTIEEFVTSKDFLAGVEFEIWPALIEDLKEMNPDVLIGEDPVHEVLLGGATGTGKTHLSVGTIAYQIYLLTCFKQPQRLFNLSPATPIVFLMQSVSHSVTKRVAYQPLRAALTGMPYFQKYCSWNKLLESELALDKNIIVVPALAQLSSMLGQAVCGALLDEVNFMSIIETSKKVPGLSGHGGRFDQAEEIYYNISRRRKRSFGTHGISVGTLCIVSSTRYNNDFLDRRIEEVRRFEEPNIRVFRRKQYEVNPMFTESRIPVETFRIAVGNEQHPTMVLKEHHVRGEHYSQSAEVLDVPVYYLTDFQKDPDAALRDVVGIATDAITPFIKQRQKINDAVARGIEREILPLVEKDEVELAEDGMPTFIPENFPESNERKNKSRWVHIDLSRNKDRCGIVMICHEGYVNRPSTEDPGTVEVLPKFTVEIAVGIIPSAVQEVDIAEVRGWVLQLIRVYGLNIEAITLDGFDSRETIQVLRKAGITSEVVSVDRTTRPYENVRDVLYQDRLDIQPDCELLPLELRTVEYYVKRNKIDHPPNGTKDVSDALAGALDKALRSRRVRSGIEAIDIEPDAGETVGRLRVRRKRIRIKRERPRRAR